MVSRFRRAAHSPHSPLSVPFVMLVAAAMLSACVSDSSSKPPRKVQAEGPAQVVAVPLPLDHRSVAGLSPLHDSTNDPEDQRSVATVSVPGEPSLQEALAASADDDIARYEAVRSEGVANELNIDWDPVLAAGPVLGVVFTTRTYTGEGTGVTSSHTFYTDVDSGSTWTAADLISEPARLSGWVADALAAADAGDSDVVEPSVVRDLRFSTDGAVTVVLGRRESQGGDGEGVRRDAGEVGVRVAPAESHDVLSSHGRQIRRAAMQARPFQGIPNPPVPSTEPATVAPVTENPQPVGDEVDCDRLRCVALTFDDGPGPYTDRLLAELAAKDTLATFFVIGQNAATLPELVAREVAAGHAVGNHSFDHPQLSTLSAAGIADQVDRTDAAIQAAAGVTPTLVRPPYGATSDAVSAVLAERGDIQVLWNVDTEDWKNRDAAITTQRALAGAAPGAIILMHDIHPTTVDAVPRIIDQLRADGYTLVTVPQLLGPSVTPGAEYFSR